MNSILQKGLSLNKKKILLRLDLNVPLNNGKIVDTNRIDKVLPTIKFLLKENSNIIVISHIGRPKGKIDSKLSLQPICESLANKLNVSVQLINKNILQLKSDEISKSFKTSKILVLENIRFYKEEENDDENFSKYLAKLGDIYVNDAFSCSHRKHSSVSSITKYIPSYCGLQFELEINSLKKITESIQKPITCIIGGSKISTKINIIKNLIINFDNIVFVGGMANNILNYKNYKVGKSIQEANCRKIVAEIFELSIKNSCKIFYPLDVCVGKKLDDISTIKNIDNVSDDELILDIGPKTIQLIENIIENSKTILWNGPAGYFENKHFAQGSEKIAKKISEENKLKKSFSVAGGGDTVAVINSFGLIDNFNFVSTAGGAFLEFLEGKELPGIKALN